MPWESFTAAAAFLWTLSGPCPRLSPRRSGRGGKPISRQQQKKSAAAEQELYRSLGAAAGRIGTPDFHRGMMQAIGALLAADLAMVMRYPRRATPQYLVDDGLVPEHMDYYLRGLYRVDPVYRLCREGEARGVYNLQAICTPEEKAGEYFSIFLNLTGMADDLVILFPTPGGATIGLVYERKTVFTPAELTQLRTLFPLLEGLHAAHAALAPKARLPVPEQDEGGLPPVDYEKALEGFLDGRLTPRERQIVRLILLGFPTAKVAERLGLSINTVKNHKKRLYLKLDITTERELFLNFVSFLFRER